MYPLVDRYRSNYNHHHHLTTGHSVSTSGVSKTQFRSNCNYNDRDDYFSHKNANWKSSDNYGYRGLNNSSTAKTYNSIVPKFQADNNVANRDKYNWSRLDCDKSKPTNDYSYHYPLATNKWNMSSSRLNCYEPSNQASAYHLKTSLSSSNVNTGRNYYNRNARPLMTSTYNSNLSYLKSKKLTSTITERYMLPSNASLSSSSDSSSSEDYGLNGYGKPNSRGTQHFRSVYSVYTPAYRLKSTTANYNENNYNSSNSYRYKSTASHLPLKYAYGSGPAPPPTARTVLSTTTTPTPYRSYLVSQKSISRKFTKCEYSNKLDENDIILEQSSDEDYHSLKGEQTTSVIDLLNRLIFL